MIPAYLEKLIWEGKASYQHAVVGGSTTSIIPVANDKIAIIYEIIVFSNNSTEPSLTDEVFFYNINQISFKETKKGGSTHFMIRSEIITQFSKESEPMAMPRGVTTFNPYLIFTEDIIVSYLRNPAMPWGNLTSTTDALGIDALGVPNGPKSDKGQLMADTVAQIVFGDAIASTTIPVTTKYFTPDFSKNPNSFNNLTFPFTDDTQMPADTTPSAVEATGTVPIINIGYVLVDKSIGNHLTKTN